MKKLMFVGVASFVLGYLGAGDRAAKAVPGMMCIDSSACGSKCEVCVKDKPNDAMGKCHQIAGCY